MSKTFKNYLRKAEEETRKLDMDSIIKKASESNPLDEISPDLEEDIKLKNLLGQIRSQKLMADAGLSAYKEQIPKNLKVAKELAKKIAEKIAAQGGKKVLMAVSGVGTALDALASDPLNQNEQSEVMEKRRQQFADNEILKNLGNNPSKLEELKKKSEELSRTSLLDSPNLIETEESQAPDFSRYLNDRKKTMGYR
jgi:aromatic ring-opening dioxygenase LigB subunit